MLIVITGWEKSLHEFRGNYNEQSVFIVGVIQAGSSMWGRTRNCGEHCNVSLMISLSK